MPSHEGIRTPAVDIFEGDDAWTVVVDVPGCEKSDVDLTLADGRLCIEARPQPPDMPASAVAQRREAPPAPFGRTIALDPSLDGAKATARLDRGVLLVTVPRRRGSAEERKVTID